MRCIVMFGLVAALGACGHSTTSVCARSRGVQILGSGGPIPDDDRASSGYLVWDEGRARVLVDAGGGVFQRFGRAGARIDDLELVALTHLHADHSADLPALLKGAYFSPRRRDLVLAGPTGAGSFPGTSRWLETLFGAEGGAFAYLSWLLNPDAGAFSLDVRELEAAHGSMAEVATGGAVRAAAIGVEHGPVPALAYRIEVGGASVVFSGDQNGDTPQFIGFAQDADVLVMHHAIAEDTGPPASKLHARPSEIGRIAHDAEVGHLVLSHHMERSLQHLDQAVALIQERYRGPVTVAEDLMCVPLP